VTGRSQTMVSIGMFWGPCQFELTSPLTSGMIFKSASGSMLMTNSKCSFHFRDTEIENGEFSLTL